jgi:hypothetical protein
MPKFTEAERILVKSIIAALSIKRIPEQDIIDEIYRQTNKTITKSGMFYIRKDIKKESYQWYKTMREGQYEFIHEFRERINEIFDLQKRHYEIDDSPIVPIPIKLASLFELHKLSVTLSNLFDVAPFITNSISNNATVPAPSEDKTAIPEATTSYVV